MRSAPVHCVRRQSRRFSNGSFRLSRSRLLWFRHHGDSDLTWTPRKIPYHHCPALWPTNFRFILLARAMKRLFMVRPVRFLLTDFSSRWRSRRCCTGRGQILGFRCWASGSPMKPALWVSHMYISIAKYKLAHQEIPINIMRIVRSDRCASQDDRPAERRIDFFKSETMWTERSVALTPIEINMILRRPARIFKTPLSALILV